MPFTEFYCQTTGSNLNSGSTASDAAVYTSPPNGGWNSGTGVFTPVSGAPNASVAVGDFASVYLDAATVAVFIARVTAVSATTITLSTSVKSGTAPTTGGTGYTCKVGGAWKGPNAAVGFPFSFIDGAMKNAAGNMPRVNMKSGTNYAITTGITMGANAAGIDFAGYTTTPGDGGRAVIDGGTNAIVLVTCGTVSVYFTRLIFQNNGTTGTNAGVTTAGGNQRFFDCVFNNIRGAGGSFSLSTSIRLEQCEFYQCNTSNTASTGQVLVSGGATLIDCFIHDGGGTTNGNGLQASGTLNTIVRCVFDTNPNDGIVSSSPLVVDSCEFYNNGGDGMDVGAGTALDIKNSNFVKNAGVGIRQAATPSRTIFLYNCGFGSGTQANTSGNTSGAAIQEAGSVTYPSNVSPYVDADNGNFRLALRVAKGTGLGAFTQTQSSYAGTIGYPDIGAAQHRDPPQSIPSIGGL